MVTRGTHRVQGVKKGINIYAWVLGYTELVGTLIFPHAPEEKKKKNLQCPLCIHQPHWQRKKCTFLTLSSK